MEKKTLKEKLNSDIKLKSWSEFILICLIVILIAGASSLIKIRLDLTEDRRYSLSEPTKKILGNLKERIFIQVYLNGDMPVLFKKLKRSVGEMLDEFRIASHRNIDYEFINPYEGNNEAAIQKEQEQLIQKGLLPVNVMIREKDGGQSQKMIFPGMIINYNNIEVPVNFLKNNPSLSPELNLLHSAEGLEYELIQVISTLVSDTVHKIAFIEGHGEVPEIEVADLILTLAKYFTIDRGSPGGKPGILDNYSAIIIAGPEDEFNERDLFVIDQYIMKGGKVIWLYEEVEVNADSLVYGETIALYKPTGLAEQLFKYGVRVNPVLVQDLECMLIPVKVVTGGTQQQIVPMPWVYYPLLVPSPAHPITRNLNRILGKYVNYIDTVGRDPEIEKTILLTTSRRARIVRPPITITLKDIDRMPDESFFNRENLPVAVLLSGKFKSAFRNRIVEGLNDTEMKNMANISSPTKMIVIADRDIIRNEVSRSGNTEIPLPLGQDRYTLQTFSNKDFLVNCINYLVDDKGLMNIRSRELKLRLLDKKLINEKSSVIKVTNVVLPVLIVVIAGIIYSIVRKKIYAK
ncbi:MAG TPA: gliding motility-associated ABC transporter substrate-binding protein GldG [Bacteroidales bacterium]|nr:gliding motility-associated ABC transporter substrate-binding protein GldG [Bacteroidales bacterium]